MKKHLTGKREHATIGVESYSKIKCSEFGARPKGQNLHKKLL